MAMPAAAEAVPVIMAAEAVVVPQLAMLEVAAAEAAHRIPPAPVRSTPQEAVHQQGTMVIVIMQTMQGRVVLEEFPVMEVLGMMVG